MVTYCRYKSVIYSITSILHTVISSVIDKALKKDRTALHTDVKYFSFTPLKIRKIEKCFK